jgi:hypothetical protein
LKFTIVSISAKGKAIRRRKGIRQTKAIYDKEAICRIANGINGFRVSISTDLPHFPFRKRSRLKWFLVVTS